MKISTLKREELTKEIIDKVLFCGIIDTPVKADCILVLGSKKAAEYRVPKAVELYRAGYAQKLMLCGGKKILTLQGEQTEAQLMTQAALSAGIPEQAIIKEEFSMTTKENILCASLMLDRAFRLCNVNTLLLVTGNYHMRRSLAMARTYLPPWIRLIPCPAPYRKTDRAQWDQTAHGVELVTNEVWNIIRYIREGSIPEIEI